MTEKSMSSLQLHTGEQRLPGFCGEWKLKRLGDILCVRHGKNQHAVEVNGGRYPILATGGEIGRTNTALYAKPSVLIGRKGTIDKPQYQDTPFWTVDTLFYTEIESKASPKFIYYVFLTIDWRSYNEASGVPSLNASTIENIKFISPPLPEQRVIATALSDVDALLTKLDALIAKKRDIKQAAMQQLLTGKQRLPGFSGEWEVKRLGDVFNVTAGGDFDPLRSSVTQDETYCFPIYSNAISDGGLYGYSSYSDHDADSITVTARGTLGAANYRDHKFTAIGRVLILKPRESVDGRLFSEFINSLMDIAVESTSVPQLTAPQISTYQLPTPSLSEQTAIAAILSDMDAEIAALEARRDKTNLLKQGMMHELLTGRIRLV